MGSLTGAVASIWGALAVTSGANLAVCWEVRSLANFRLRKVSEGMKNPELPNFMGENTTGADNQQGSPRNLKRFQQILVTPQRLYARLAN